MSIQSEIERINNAKTEIAEAISEKGVPVAEGTSIDNLPGLIRSIPQEGGESVEEIFWVTCDLDPNSLTASNFSHTYDEIIQSANDGKTVKGKGLISGLSVEFLIFDLTYVGGYSGQLVFDGFLGSVIEGQAVCLYIRLKMNADNNIEHIIRIVNTTNM